MAKNMLVLNGVKIKQKEMILYKPNAVTEKKIQY